MKKTVIASVAFAAALFAVSCQKENNPAQNVSGPMTISAVSEGLNTPTKTELAFKYDVLWSTSDKIYVKDASGNNDTFSLTGGDGTTKGTFKQDGDATFTGEVQAYYPATMLQSGSPLWPASQTNDQTIPMYCKKTLSGAAEERMDFSSLGSVLQIVFNTTQENVTLKSIEIKDGSATLSGVFTVDENGKAVISATDKAGITLDLGTGAALGKAANYFNIAVPAGNYQDLTLVFTATDGKKCTMTKGKVNIAYNAVGRLTLMGEKFKADVPDGALTGKFSVSDTKQVYFSKGNLYADASGATPVSCFEANQYDFRTYPDKGSCINGTYNQNSGTPSGHYGLFTWSNTVADAVGNSNSGNNLFTNDPNDEKKANSDFKVKVGDIEQSGWRTLTTAEWQYLFNYGSYTSEVRNGKYKAGVTVCGSVNCIVIAPDDWNLSTNPLQSSYGTESSEGNPMTWEQAETAGLVCLPAAGSRLGSSVGDVGDYGSYWSSTAVGGSHAYDVGFDSGDVGPDDSGSRNFGFSVRLITESN